MNENEMMDIAKEVAKGIAKDTYEDIGKPVTKPTGELLGLLPRIIKAALAPIEKWVLQKEYNIEETIKLLEKKLENISPDLIESPESHIAVPALKYISYCIDNDELRDMYANLLASAMNSVVKNGVHPAFVEIIKQLCPDEAKFLKYLYVHPVIPTVTMRYVSEKQGGIDICKDFSNIPEKIRCENPYAVSSYIDNLVRLGLLQRSTLSYLVDKSVYQPLKEHKYFSKLKDLDIISRYNMKSYKFDEGYVTLTNFGRGFCQVCLSTTKENYSE